MRKRKGKERKAKRKEAKRVGEMDDAVAECSSF